MLKEIKNGVYKNHYLVYNRKSTDEPENQKNSIQYQKSENLRFSLREKLPIAPISIEGFCIDGIVSEKHSAFKEDNDLIIGKNGTVQYNIDRPKFHHLIHFLNNGYFKGVVVLCWDRISRNKGDETIIRKLMKSGIDFRFVLATYDKTSAGALHMDIDGMFAEHHSRVTSEKVKLNIKNQREKGICTYKAPVGYLNTGSMEHKPIDPLRAPLIKKMFELYATGEWTLISLAKWAIDNGFTLAPFRRRKTIQEKQQEEESDVQIEIEAITRIPTYGSIHNILTNPFYTGKILGNDGQYIKSRSHEPLVTEDLFNIVQRELAKKKVSVHYTENLKYPLRGIIRCGECHRVYTPYPKKGILYFGARCAPGCTNSFKSFNTEFITERIGDSLQNLILTESEAAELTASVNTNVAFLESQRKDKEEVHERQMRKLREDLAYLQANKLNLLKTGVYTPEALKEEEELLKNKISKLEVEEQTSEASVQETVKQVIILSELLKTLKLQYSFANPYEKEEIIKLLFSELYFSEKDLQHKCKNGLQALESRFIQSGDPNTWISELYKYSHSIKETIKNIEAFELKGKN